ncbi:MAG TPA: GC-type dockerin domain-anchored protein [Phycisphaerales bacterium]|nr:GC-type dockerin domain-anchored protein [Phycisphaerales bacterium]
MRRVIAAAGLSLGLAADMATGDGFLWLGSEFQAEGTIFRYNLQTGTIDRVVSPPRPSGVTHWNNMAIDGSFLYIGSPSSQYVGVCDLDTGAVLASHTYTPALSGHKEDGAYHPGTGNLWRATFSNLLHEVTPTGQLVRTYTGGGALVGLEWVGGTLYATNYSNGDIGVLSLNPANNTATFTPVPWAPGGPTISETAALAYDADSGVLYMTANRHRLWSVSFSNGMAAATLVADLSTLGYPAGGLIDGMGWFPLPCPADFNDDGSVTTADVSAFLVAWFADLANGTLHADFNASGATTTADISAYLTAWFQALAGGC